MRLRMKNFNITIRFLGGKGGSQKSNIQREFSKQGALDSFQI